MNHQRNSTPNNPLLRGYLKMFGILGIIVLVLLVLLIMGQLRNSKMTDLDVINNTNIFGERNDCYFDNVKVNRNANGEITSLDVKDQDYKIDIVPFIDPDTKKIIAYKASREQIMYCTNGRFNYKTPFITESRILSEQPPEIAAAKAPQLQKDKLFKRVEKIGKYFMD